MNPNDVARYAYQYYLKRGLSPQAAAGIVGNLAVESGNFSPKVISGTRRGDSGSAHYVQQLRGSRLDNFRQFAKQTGRDESDLEAQLDFVLEEYNAKSPFADKQASGNADALFGARSPEEAAHAMMNHYERPNPDANVNKIGLRTGYASSLVGEAPNSSEAPPFGQVAEAFSGQPPQQVGQMASYPAQGDQADVSYTALGFLQGAKILSGESPGFGLTATPGDTTGMANLWTPPPVSVQQAPPVPVSLPIGEPQASGLQSSLAASRQTQFGPIAANDGVDLDGMDDGTKDALSMAASFLGRNIPINSGYRSQAKQDRIRNNGDPNRITVAKHSKHTEGNAVDIPIKDMTEEEIAALTDALAGAGFTAFGYYGKNGHLHADMRDAVPNSFDPDKGWGGWTSLPPYVMQALIKRGFKPGASADSLLRGYGA